MNRKIKLDEVLEEVQTLREQNRKLILENEEYHEMLKSEMDKNQDLNNQLERQVRFKMGLKFSNRRLTQQRNELQEELDTIKSMGMFEFGNTYCSSESLEADGHAFARSLGVGTMTSEDLAEERAISQGEAHYEATWNINCGDDF